MIGLLLALLVLAIFPVGISTLILYRHKIKRLIMDVKKEPYFIAHILVKAGNIYVEKKAETVKLEGKTFEKDHHEYIINPDKAIWRPTGLFGKPELHIYYEAGRNEPLSFYKPDLSIDGKLQKEIFDEKLIRAILRGMQPGLQFNLRQILTYIVIAIAIIVIIYIMMPAFFPTVRVST